MSAPAALPHPAAPAGDMAVDGSAHRRDDKEQIPEELKDAKIDGVPLVHLRDKNSVYRDVIPVFRTWVTVAEMLTARGYNASVMPLTLESFCETRCDPPVEAPGMGGATERAPAYSFRRGLQSGWPMAIVSREPNAPQLLLYFFGKLDSPDVRNIFDYVTTQRQSGRQISRALCIVTDLAPRTQDALDKIRADHRATQDARNAQEQAARVAGGEAGAGFAVPVSAAPIVEVFREESLRVNITKHRLVPKHELMSSEEADDFLARMSLKRSQIPKIKFEDPVARFFGAQKDDLFRITRPSETAGLYVSYRVVVG
eukprot:TRINITY_DN12630_c0_g1_i1.p1 TRINITY_DN12630_c0_g1~~TRINITY_DN12630_c0_g1_i1.p1  ORF type:complete len:331 (-),score=28.87 TRINITY_DN12630_c0_g1_i1:246-1184(-)